MNIRYIYSIGYFIGSIIMFIGILWMMLPHAYHERLINESDSNHVFHIIQGLITTLIGLSIMLCNNKLSNKIEKNNKN